MAFVCPNINDDDLSAIRIKTEKSNDNFWSLREPQIFWIKSAYIFMAITSIQHMAVGSNYMDTCEWDRVCSFAIFRILFSDGMSFVFPKLSCYQIRLIRNECGHVLSFNSRESRVVVKLKPKELIDGWCKYFINGDFNESTYFRINWIRLLW